jgi:hypothetical protein
MENVMASPDTPTPKTPTYICGNCSKEFKADDTIARTKKNVFKADARFVKLSRIEDVVKYGDFNRGLVVICPKCKCFHDS